MKIKPNENLSAYTTFKIGGPAKYFCVAKNPDDIREAILFAKQEKLPVLILGGGSNMLVSDKGFAGLAVKIDLRGWQAQERGDSVFLTAAAGENWDNLVELAVKKAWWGIENLSHIPGKVGAIAVQNVGAYGQEASQVIDKVEVLEKQSGKIFKFRNRDCGFAYRASIFNTTQHGKFIILSITFKLSRLPRPNLWYRDLSSRFLGKHPSLADIRRAVIEIRNKKFPFPTGPKNGNAGSFFKNIIIDQKQFQRLGAKISESLGHDALDFLNRKAIPMHKHFKIPAAPVLEICGLKGLDNKQAKINQAQPLVILNFSGKAKAADVLGLAAKVLKTVREKTGLILDLEPELVGFSPAELKKYGIID